MSDQEEAVNLNLLDQGVRLAGLVLMGLNQLLALSLIAWVWWNRASPVVKAKQVAFLILLAFGTIVTSSTIIPLGADDQNASNVSAACQAYQWLNSVGAAFILSALFSKLYRVNQIFHADRYQRKVVTVKDVLWPFAILVSLNVLFLTIETAVDPVEWDRVPIDNDENDTIGYCSHDGPVGIAMEALRMVVNFIALIFLCIQAYRARDVSTEFSEARGIAIALFTMLQAVIIVFPTEALLEKEDRDARYMLLVLLEVVTNLSLLFFIFGPIVAHSTKVCMHWLSGHREDSCNRIGRRNDRESC